MKPQIKSLETWNKAELLLQPSFIRLLDNFRKTLETSDWQSHYENIATWPDGTTEAQKAQYEELIEKLEHAKPAEVAEVEDLLAQIPEPAMAYELQLSRGEEAQRQVQTFDMWQLCYQVCFRNYIPGVPDTSQAVDIDEALLNAEGEVDWDALDGKVKAIVEGIVNNLSS